MTSDAFAILQCLFNTVWSLFTSWNIPGTHTNPAMWFSFLIVASMGLRTFKRLVLGADFDSSSIKTSKSTDMVVKK